nr:diacylglycerol kinase family lipid kinase [Propionibacterium sp.]
MSRGPRRPTLTLLVNPAAGRGRARWRLPTVVDRLGAALPATDVVVRFTADAVDARALASDAVARAEPGDALVVLGGDGMASVGLNAAAGSGVPLGILPAGTGNDFCRGVGLPTKLDAALAVVAAGATREVDLMSVTGDLADGTDHRWVGSIVSTGFDERVNWRANHVPVNVGAPTYAYAVFAELRTFRPLPYRLVVDGVVRELDAILVAVGNAGVFGGGIRVCPDARVDDGLLDVTIVHPVSPALLVKLFPQLFTGRFTEHPAVELLRAREVVIDGDGLFGMADGELLGRPPLTCRAVPAAVRLFAPGSPTA